MRPSQSARLTTSLTNQSSQQDGFNPAPESDPAIDFNDRHATIVSLAKNRIGIDINAFRYEPVRFQESLRVIAKMTPEPRVQYNA